MKTIWKIILVLLLLLVGFFLKTFWQAGGFKTITNEFKGEIQKVYVPGVEDITIDQETGVAFLSSYDRWKDLIHKSPEKGGIYALHLEDSMPHPIHLTPDFPKTEFHPHGISLYISPEGKRILYVINHQSDQDAIEIFEYYNDTLEHKASITDPLIISPNDIVGVGERSFYMTNDHNERASTSRSIKDLAQIGTGNIVYYDGEKANATGIEDVTYANGINVSLDGKTLYMSSPSDNTIYTYDRNIETGTLTYKSEFFTNTGVDNIELDTEGNLWVGCHPQLLKFLSHAGDSTAHSPSEVIKLTPKDNSFEQATIYINDGSELSASATGAVYKDNLLIGPVFSRHFLWCKME